MMSTKYSSELPCLPVGLHSIVSPCTVGAERIVNCQAQGKLYLGLSPSPSMALSGHRAQYIYYYLFIYLQHNKQCLCCKLKRKLLKNVFGN